jgi:hypothetical protein
MHLISQILRSLEMRTTKAQTFLLFIFFRSIPIENEIYRYIEKYEVMNYFLCVWMEDILNYWIVNNTVHKWKFVRLKFLSVMRISNIFNNLGIFSALLRETEKSVKSNLNFLWDDFCDFSLFYYWLRTRKSFSITKSFLD